MKKFQSGCVVLGSLLMMGMSMPSCPGQKEMQQQIDLLQTQNTDLAKKVQGAETHINALNNDMAQVKQLLPQITSVMQAQKGEIDELRSKVTELETKVFKGIKKKK